MSFIFNFGPGVIPQHLRLRYDEAPITSERRRDYPPFVSATAWHSLNKCIIYYIYWVYVLKCSDDGYYVGCTHNLKKRYLRHIKGYVRATKYRLPVQLFQYHAFNEKITAFNFEKYLKTSSGRAFAKKHFSESLVWFPLSLSFLFSQIFSFFYQYQFRF